MGDRDQHPQAEGGTQQLSAFSLLMSPFLSLFPEMAPIKWLCHPVSPLAGLCLSLSCPSVRWPTGVPLGPSPRGKPGARSTTHTPRAPVSTPAACFLGISGRAEPGAQVFSALGREGRSSASSQPCLCFLFTSEGGWGPRGLRPALWSEASQAV